MPDPDPPKTDPSDAPDGKTKLKDDGPGLRDVAAVGIGCLIFIIFFGAIAIAALTRE
jgi:hypothetical protein